MADVQYAELEIGLSSLGGNRYRVDIQYWPRSDAADDARQPRVSGEARLDPQEFLGKSPEAYGALLAERVFEDPKVRDVFVLARSGTYGGAQPAGLRVRLWFDRNAERLQDLRWEALCEPGGQTALSTHDLVPLSRFPASEHNRQVLVRPKGDLRALVLIANPAFDEILDTGARVPAQVNVAGEWTRVRDSLAGLAACCLLADHPDASAPPTVDALQKELNSTGYDILYLVCHGVLDSIDGPFLLLENDQGGRADMPGSVLLNALEAGTQLAPRLVVLSACQSAGTGLSTGNQAHLALGPGLVRAGVPAVLSMNGKVSMETAGEFNTRFFSELKGHGCVDRAVTTARRIVRDLPRPDWWMPVLYMRLSAGRIWSVPHLIQRSQEPYDELGRSLQNRNCLPVVGPALLEPVWGSARSIARDLAEKLGFPLAPFRREDLPAVAQYVARRHNGQNLRLDAINAWLAAAEAALKRKWPGLAATIAGLDAQTQAERVISLLRAAAPMAYAPPGQNPFALLARLPASIYLTATPDPLLADALEAAGRPPIVEYTRWTSAMERRKRNFDESDNTQEPTREHPLVFHLFGRLQDPDSIVLTEDDYFDFLIHVVKDDPYRAIPSLLHEAYSQNALMVLGFDLDEWCFRAFYRLIQSEPGYQHSALSAAVQLNPEEDRHLRPEAALEYLERVFGTENINLSWIPPQEFLHEVWQLLPPALGGPP